MKAAVFQGRGRGHQIETVADPSPSDVQVVLRIERSGLCGTDVSLTKERDSPTLIGPDLENAFAAPGTILGHEYCGEVVEVGSGAQRLKLGDLVAPMFFTGCNTCAACLLGDPAHCASATPSMGGFAEYGLAHDRFSLRLPEGLTSADGALVEPLATSLRTVTIADISPGDRVLVLGAGALGLGVAFFARMMGARGIAAVARTDAKAQSAARMGVDHFLTQSDDIPQQAADLLGGYPDVVFETAGVPGLIDQAIACARPSGTIVSAGTCLVPEMTGHAIAALKTLTIKYTMAYEVKDFAVIADLLARDKDSPLRDIASAAPIGFGDFASAFEAQSRGSLASKVTLDPWKKAA